MNSLMKDVINQVKIQQEYYAYCPIIQNAKLVSLTQHI